MKLNIATNDVELGGVTETAAFKVEMNAMLFHSVIDGIYADKIRSPFRELCTNARDGHAAKGNLNEPFDVFLPSTLNPVFKVRDYGVGLSHEDVMGLYTTMFASSKRDSNEAVGMIGLGSKSPFAYTSAFTVVSWFGGWETVYSAFIGDDGVPQIALMSKRESTEPTGMEISMPIQQKDIATFRTAAPEVLFGFDPFPRILNETFTYVKPTIKHEGKGWKLYDKTKGGFPTSWGMMARQGCVLYPINSTALKVQVKSHSYVNNGLSSNIYTWPVVLDFPIGDLDVATSREQLGYTEKTINAINARVAEMQADFTKMLEDEIDKQESYLDACIYYADSYGQHGEYRTFWTLFGPNVTYKGKKLVTDWRGTNQNNRDKPDGFEITVITKPHPDKMFLGANTGTFRSSKYPNHLTITARDRKKMKVYYEYEDCTFGPSRIKTVLAAAQPGDVIMWVRAKTPLGVELAVRPFLDPPRFDLSTFDRMITPREQIEAKKKSVGEYKFRMAILQRNLSLYRADYETLVPTNAMIGIPQDDKMYQVREGRMLTLSDLNSELDALVSRNLIAPGTKVYFVNKTHEKLKDTIKFKTLREAILEHLTATGQLATMAAAVHNARQRQKIANAKRFLELSADVRVLPRHRKYFEQLAAIDLPVIAENYAHRQLKQYLESELMAEANRVNQIYEQYDAVLAEYPLFETALSSPEIFRHYMELLLK